MLKSSGKTISKADSIDSFLVCLWPLGILLCALFSRQVVGNSSLVQVFQFVSLCIPILYLLPKGGLKMLMNSLKVFNDAKLFFLLVVLLLGGVIGFNPIKSIMYIILVFLSFIICALYLQVFDNQTIINGLGLFAILGSLILGLCSIGPFASMTSTRAVVVSGLSVNSIGFFAMTCGSFAFAIKNHLLRYATIAFVLLCLYVTNSRSSILGLGIVCFLYMLFPDGGTKELKLNLIMLCVALIFVSLYLAFFIDLFFEVTAINDVHRGLDSGFSGRVSRWKFLWEIFKENPLLGVGFRCSDEPLGTCSDSGYVSFLTETGLIGSILTIAIFVCSFCNSLLSIRNRLVKLLFFTSMGYLAHSFFERFIFNVGNPGSILFAMWIIFFVVNKRNTGVNVYNDKIESVVSL